MLVQNNLTNLQRMLRRHYISHLNQACTKIGNKQENKRIFKVWRYDGGESNEKARWVSYELNISGMHMILDVMIRIKEIDPTFTFRRSCREGICGSCGINVQGYNTLACTSFIPKDKTIIIRPLPHMYVVRDLVVDMTHFYNSYNSIKPYLIREKSIPKFGSSQYAQSPKERQNLDGLYECILCGCCSTACPSYWWNGRRFLGPAALLNAYRWIIDSRDTDTERRLYGLRDDFKVYRCHMVMNCTLACPKELNPAQAIAKLKQLISGLRKRPAPLIDPMKYVNQKCARKYC